ncbi:hypothetical protein D9757_014411 [Collybiopsis confluens]|uniref:Uncharacterized protein n=1 Tax=Collybiopsis confluens TaxID=2823264 RepID=A0A8H5CNP1_9AGAR|nr:hypothetical protein D9757_014411 [Collybiopsis confluens]
MLPNETIDALIEAFPPLCTRVPCFPELLNKLENSLKASPPPHGRELSDKFLIDFDRRERDREYQPPPKLYYGYALNLEDCLLYFRDHQANLPDISPNKHTGLLSAHISMIIEDHLTKLCDFTIRIGLVLDMKFDYIVRIYDSYGFQDYQLEDKDEKEVVDILKQEFPKFNVQGNPRWFYAG